MNITHLKYALEVEKTGSITKAAQNLFMGQPNLSKALKELEESIGITLFTRTPKGAIITQEGQKFLSQAHVIVSQIEQMERLYRPLNKQKISFNICIPRASYIAYAFTRFMNHLKCEEPLEINFKETHSIEAMRHILEKQFEMKEIWNFEYMLLCSTRHPLAHKKTLELEDLKPYVELVHGDLTVPKLTDIQKKKVLEESYAPKHIFVYERGSQFDLLSEVPTTYMWVSPLPEAVLKRYGLVQRRCHFMRHKNKDVLIYLKHHTLTALEESFIHELTEVKEEMRHIYSHI